MFSAYLALAALPLTLVHGLTISNPTETVTSTGSHHHLLINQSFNNQYAIANNVDSSLGSLSLTLPQIPAEDGYTIELVNISNINDIYAQTGTFSVAEPVSSSASASSTGSASQSGSSASASASGSASASSGSASALLHPRVVHPRPPPPQPASTASSSAFNAASRAQVGGAGILAAVLAWVVAI
ncbi:hypothetical protein F5146DRAFT_1069529 [Armillaria mellea]|nr:hypothetical protein F5146DRAFT_1069529 [Armillaria mellea]